MKKELSFYEFAGILVPSVTFLYFTFLIINYEFKIIILDFGKVGDSIVFIIICYAFGHLLHGLGNILEKVIWLAYKRKPTEWFVSPNRFGKYLFDKNEADLILKKFKNHFGDNINKNYHRIIYSYLYSKNITLRIDTFNGNFSLMRGLSVCFILLSLLSIIFLQDYLFIIPLSLSIISIARMIRFSKYYARELYRTFLTIEE